MSTIDPGWSPKIDKRADGLVALRRDFHRHPELSWEERRTSEIVAERLHAAGLLFSFKGIKRVEVAEERIHPA